MPTSTTLSPDGEPGPLVALALCSLEGLPIGRGKEGVVQSGSAARRWSDNFPGIPPRPGHRGSSSGQLSATVFTKHHRPLPSAPASSSSPAERSSLGQEEGLAQARAVLLPKGSGPHPTICPGVEWDPTWKKMGGTVSTEEHLGKIQDAYSET